MCWQARTLAVTRALALGYDAFHRIGAAKLAPDVLVRGVEESGNRTRRRGVEESDSSSCRSVPVQHARSVVRLAQTMTAPFMASVADEAAAPEITPCW